MMVGVGIGTQLARRTIPTAVPGWSPLQLPSLQLWLDASVIAGLADGAAVATWSDRSGQNNHIVQATPTKQPLYKTAIINGLPVVRFDGVDDLLTATLPTAMQVDSYTYIVVAQTVSKAVNQGLILAGESGAQLQVMTIHSNSKFSWGASAGGSVNIPQSVVLVGGNPRILVGRRSVAENSVLLRMDGAPETVSTPLIATTATYGTTKLLVVGGKTTAQFIQADVAEAMMCATDLTTAQIAQAEQYLGARYGIAVTQLLDEPIP